jgi:RNA polymerase sigma-70 factor (ECF subfamily)
MIHKKHAKARDNDTLLIALYEQHASAVLMYLRRHGAQNEDAEDLLLEVFLAAMESSTLLNMGSGEQRAWLQRVAHNKLVDHQRQTFRRRFVALDEAMEALFDEDSAPEHVALRNENHTQLREHLATLPELQQEVLHLRFALGLRSKEIAQVLNKSDEAIRTLLSRAINVLRTIYNQKERGEQNNG